MLGGGQGVKFCVSTPGHREKRLDGVRVSVLSRAIGHSHVSWSE